MSTGKVSDSLGGYWRNKRNRKTIYITGLIAILLAGGLYWHWQNQKNYVPPQFFEARNRAGEISGKIVSLTDASVGSLRLIGAADEAGNYRKGLDLTLKEIERNTEIRGEAFKLSEELRAMVLNLGAVKPEEAIKVGLEATTSGLELAERLINYSNYTQELLSVLQTRLKENGSPETRERIEQIILKMNEEVQAVNELNKRYQDQMKEFDRLTR